MKKLVLLTLVCLSIEEPLQGSSTFTFDNFKVLTPKAMPPLLKNTLELSPGTMPKTVYIIFPDAPTTVFSSTNPATKIGFAHQDMITFLQDQKVTQTSTVLVLDWLDNGQKAINELVTKAGTEVAKFIDTIKKYQPEITLVGLGRGGVVATGIVNQIILPKQVTLITIGTPFPQDSSKHAPYTIINKNNLRAAYIFYSDIPYRSSVLIPTSTSKPAQVPADTTYFLKTVANNKQQSTHKIPFLQLQDVLDACAAAGTDYAAHKELWASFSNIKTETHGLVGIYQAAPKNAPLTQVVQEQIQSNQATKTYKKNWGNTPALTAKSTAPTRAKYKLTPAKPS